MIPGYDISEVQGALTFEHWKQMARDVGWVSIRCGNGNDGVDARFQENLANARAVNLPALITHVYFPLPVVAGKEDRSPTAQANAHFLAASSSYGRPALDLEWPAPEDWAKWGIDASSIFAGAEEYLETMDRHTGRTTTLYQYRYWFERLAADVDTSPLGARPLWLAAYDVAEPGSLPPWAAPTFWQKSDGGARLPNGCPVDEGLFLRTADELATFFAGS